MPGTIQELERRPESGFLGYERLSFGLGKVSEQLDALGARATALGRLGKSDGSDAPISPTGEERG
jgi:hypothetical protein